MTKAKQNILNLLKKGELAQTRIAGTCGVDYNYCLKILNELKKEGKVIETKFSHHTYWKLAKSKSKPKLRKFEEIK